MSKGTQTRTRAHLPIWEGGSTLVTTGGRVTLHVHGPNRGYVKIWAPDVSVLPDVLVLVGTEAGSGREVFRFERPVAEAFYFQSAERPPGDSTETPAGFATWILWFRADTNAAQGTPREVLAETTTYTLYHRPGGTEAGEYPLFVGQSPSSVFKAGRSRSAESRSGMRHGVPAAGDDSARRQMISLVATRFYAGDTPKQGATSRGGSLDRRRVWALGAEPARVDVVERAAAETAVGAPALDQVVPLLPEAIREARPWLSLYVRADPRQVGPVWGVLNPERGEDYAWRVDNASEARGLVGVWEAQPDGKLRHASYADLDAASTPTVTGPPTPYILLPTSPVSDSPKTLYAHVFYAPPPVGRARHLRDVGLDGQDAVVPVDFASDGVVLDTDAPNARWDGVAGVWKVYIPDPLRVLARLAAGAAESARTLDAWAGEAAPVLENAGLVAMATLDPGHRRRHLAEVLAPAERDVAGEWNAAGARPVDGYRDGTRLGQFLYGVAQQQGALAADIRAAVAAADRWIEGGFVRGLTCDLVAADRPGGERTVAGAGAGLLFGLLAASCRNGGRGGAVAVLESGFPEAARVIGRVEDLGDALTPIRQAEDTEWTDALALPTITLWWKVVRKGTPAALDLFEGVAPSVKWVAEKVRRVAVRQSIMGLVAPDGAIAMAAVGEDLFTRSPGGPGPVLVEQETFPTGATRTRGMWLGADQESVRWGPFVLDRVGRKGIEETWSRVPERPGPRTAYDRRALGHWEVSYDRTMTVGQVAQAAGNVVTAGLDVMNAVLLGAAIAEHIREGGTFRARDGMATVRAAADLLSAWEHLGRGGVEAGGHAAKLLRRAGPMAEATIGAAEAYDAVRHREQRGAQDVPDVDETSLVGALVTVTAAVAATAGAVGTGPVAATVGVLGAVFSVLGAGVLWAGEWQEGRRRLAQDPLADWFRGEIAGAADSTWGVGGALPDAAAALALPDWSPGGGGGLKATFEARTADFVKHAFTFPTALWAAPGDGAVEVVVVPDYLPTAGTLLLSADVTFVDAISGLDAEASVRCVISYARDGDGFRYAVSAAGPARVNPARPLAAVVAAGADALGAVRDATALPAEAWGARSVPLTPTEWAALGSGPAPWGGGTRGGLVVRAVGAGGPVGTRPDEVAVGSLAGVGPGASVTGAAFYRPLDPADRAVPDPDAEERGTAVDRFEYPLTTARPPAPR